MSNNSSNRQSMKKSKHQAKARNPKGQRSDKPKFSRLHAIKRADERYGIHLSMAEVERIEFHIRQRHECFFLEKSSNTRSLWLMSVQGHTCVVVYNNAQKCLSTFLPVWYAKRYLNGEDLPRYNENYHEEL